MWYIHSLIYSHLIQQEQEAADAQEKLEAQMALSLQKEQEAADLQMRLEEARLEMEEKQRALLEAQTVQTVQHVQRVEHVEHVEKVESVHVFQEVQVTENDQDEGEEDGQYNTEASEYEREFFTRACIAGLLRFRWR